MPVPIPDGVKVSLESGVIRAEGPKGSAELSLSDAVDVTVDDSAREVRVALRDMSGLSIRVARKQRAMWGTTQRLISNLIVGVHEGYTKQLQVVGVGYNAKVEGQTLVLRCGFANELRVAIPEGITVDPPESGNLTITGAGQAPCVNVKMHSVDKQAVGQFAAAVRSLRKPEPYKGKGIRYLDEEVKRKAGKALAGTTA